jgi:hypothetical protein
VRAAWLVVKKGFAALETSADGTRDAAARAAHRTALSNQGTAYAQAGWPAAIAGLPPGAAGPPRGHRRGRGRARRALSAWTPAIT